MVMWKVIINDDIFTYKLQALIRVFSPQTAKQAK